MGIIGTVKNLILTCVYLLFIGACGEQIYNDLKNEAKAAHKRGVINMSNWSRELTK